MRYRQRLIVTALTALVVWIIFYRRASLESAYQSRVSHPRAVLDADHLSKRDLTALTWKKETNAEFNFTAAHLEANSIPFLAPEYDTEPGHLLNATSTTVPKYTAAIAWLTRRQKLAETAVSLESIARNMPMAQPYSMLMMHSGDLSSDSIQHEFRDRLLARAAALETAEAGVARKLRVMESMLVFVYINMDVPVGIAKKGKDALEPMFFGGNWPGYHSMCRFFAVSIFWHPQIRNYDYYMRMDSDSYIITPMIEDPFRRAVRHGIRYAFRKAGGDPDFAVRKLPAYLLDYTNRHPKLDLADKLRAGRFPVMKEDKDIPTWYNNWEIAHLASFRKPEVADFLLDLLKHEEGFYKHRWGDAGLRRATTLMFFEPGTVVQYCDFKYHHQHPMYQVALPTEDNPFPGC